MALVGRNCGGLTTNGCIHDVAARALLPTVVSVGAFVRKLWSHGPREARLPTTRSQSAASPASQHQSSRVSVLGLIHGYWFSCASGGFAGKTSQRARYGCGAAVSSMVKVPVYVRGSTVGPNTQTSAK